MKLNRNNTRTFEEYVFATLLDSLAIDYHVQVSFDDYWPEHYGVSQMTVDFVVYADQSLVFEIDGPSHRAWRQRRKDQMRDEFLEANGFKVVRIKNDELQLDDLRPVASRVWSLVFGDE